MKRTFLQEILNIKKSRVESKKKRVNLVELKKTAHSIRSYAEPYRLQKSLSSADEINIIAEIKRASPSLGTINESIDVADMANRYKDGGACAISVLTEEDFFKGSLDDLRKVRTTVDLPILQKDFIVDEFQIYEAANAGADAVLLIAAMLDNKALENLYYLADRELHLDALIEVHTLEELQRVEKIEAKIIGVNNRDLQTFEVSLKVSRELIKHSPPGALMIAESGLKTSEELTDLKNLGFDGFLIGETLMKTGDPVAALKELTRR